MSDSSDDAASGHGAPPGSPLADLALFCDKRLIVLGGFGSTGASHHSQQWRSMWDAFKQYGDGSDPPKEVPAPRARAAPDLRAIDIVLTLLPPAASAGD